MSAGYLAVDGGGSSTEFLLEDCAGRRLASFVVGSTSKKSIGFEGAQANVLAGIRLLRGHLDEMGLRLEDVFGVWGLSGCDSEADRREYEGMLVAAGLDLSRHKVINDSLLALRLCTQGPGIVVIAGTGSVAVGVGEDGSMRRIGGWGYQASDLGSGCWAGTQLLREALLHDDGCRADDPAFDRVREQLGCVRGQMGPAAALLDGANQIAAFARIAMESQDSPVCESIRQQGASYLAGYVASVAESLFGGEGAPEFQVVFAGGLFKNDGFAARVMQLVQEQGIPEERIRCITGSPVGGGIVLAHMMFDR